jgi:hypothetical protein
MTVHRGQSIIEYTIMIGIVTLVLFFMGTGIKRGVQSLVKVTADQVGNQLNSDQDFNDVQQGYMVASNTESQDTKNDITTEIGWWPNGANAAIFLHNTAYNEGSVTLTNTQTNGGWQPTQ